MDLVERVGTGLMRIQEQLKRSECEPARFTFSHDSHFFEIEFKRPEKYRNLQTAAADESINRRSNHKKVPRKSTQKRYPETGSNSSENIKFDDRKSTHHNFRSC